MPTGSSRLTEEGSCLRLALPLSRTTRSSEVSRKTVGGRFPRCNQMVGRRKAKGNRPSRTPLDDPPSAFAGVRFWQRDGSGRTLRSPGPRHRPCPTSPNGHRRCWSATLPRWHGVTARRRQRRPASHPSSGLRTAATLITSKSDPRSQLFPQEVKARFKNIIVKGLWISQKNLNRQHPRSRSAQRGDFLRRVIHRFYPP